MEEIKEQKQLEVDKSGELSLTALNDQLAFAKRLIAEEMISNTFKNPHQVLLGIQYSKALNLPALIGLRMMYVVKGKPSLYAEGPLSLCQRSPVFEGIEELFLDAKGNIICVTNKNLNAKVYASVTRVKRKGDPAWQEDYFTLDDLKQAGLDFSSKGKKETWLKWERIMLRYKARSIALRSKFADCLAGMNIAEYHDSFSPEVPEIVVEENSLVKELNDKYLKEQEELLLPKEPPKFNEAEELQ